MAPSNPSSSKPTAATQASSRLNQVSNHINASSPSSSTSSNSGSDAETATKKTRKKKSAKPPAPPADWSDIRGQVSTLQRLAATPNPSHKGYSRQKQAGKLWVRERVDALLDSGSLREVGSVAGTVGWEYDDSSKDKQEWERESIKDFVPSNSVQGFGQINKRKIVFTADDFSLRAGHADGALWEKTVYIEKLALTLRLPIVKLVDGSSGGGSVTTIAKTGFSYVPPLPGLPFAVQQLNKGIPNLGAVLGPAIGLGAARVTMCHFSVMAADVGSLFNAGPKVVEGATFEEGLTTQELGGPDIHCRNGTIDNPAKNERDAFEQLRTVLGYLPNSGLSAPPVVASNDDLNRVDESLRSIIPRRKNRTYSARKIITTVVDKDSFFEVGPVWGITVIVGFARLAGRPVGIVANNCEVLSGALDASGSQKLAKHIKLCDVMNLPILQLPVDVPGYSVGTVAERSATMRHGVNCAAAYFTTTTPVFSVVVRKAYGVAGGVLLDCRDPRMRVAWPSGDWGSLPLEGGIEVGHSGELKKIAKEDGPEAAKERYDELEKMYKRLMNPVRTANAFGIEEIIDPATTRGVVCAWAKYVYDELMPLRLMERTSGKLQPQFA